MQQYIRKLTNLHKKYFKRQSFIRHQLVAHYILVTIFKFLDRFDHIFDFWGRLIVFLNMGQKRVYHFWGPPIALPNNLGKKIGQKNWAKKLGKKN